MKYINANEQVNFSIPKNTHTYTPMTLFCCEATAPPFAAAANDACVATIVLVGSVVDTISVALSTPAAHAAACDASAVFGPVKAFVVDDVSAGV